MTWRSVREWADKVRLASIVEITNDASLLLASGTPDVGAWPSSPEPARSPLAGRATDASSRGRLGYILGDEKAARMEFVTAALRASARAADQRGLEQCCWNGCWRSWNCSDKANLSQRFMEEAGIELACDAAPLVMEAAETDEVARTIVADAATELALAAATVARSSDWPWNPSAGCHRRRRSLERRLSQADRGGLTRLRIVADPVTAVTEPAEGAIRIAFRQVLKGTAQ